MDEQENTNLENAEEKSDVNEPIIEELKSYKREKLREEEFGKPPLMELSDEGIRIIPEPEKSLEEKSSEVEEIPIAKELPNQKKEIVKEEVSVIEMLPGVILGQLKILEAKVFDYDQLVTKAFANPLHPFLASKIQKLQEDINNSLQAFSKVKIK